MKSRCHKSCDVSHIHHKICANLVCDFPHSLKIYYPAVSAGSGNYHFGMTFKGYLLTFVIIKKAVFINSVGYAVIISTGNICR